MTLKELLNELIREGWKPRGKIDMEFMYMLGDKEHPIHQLFFKWGASGVISAIVQHHIRELVSKESGLWQFVCENGMVEIGYKEWLNEEVENGETISSIDEISMESYYYRLIESALKDESELESFILDNIKIGND